MRYAIESPQVRWHLQGFTAASWVLIPFFFSDRGAEIQKTVEGLLQELLYQILSRFVDLIDVVAHIYTQALKEAIPPLELLPLPGRFFEGMEWSRSAINNASIVFRAARSHPIDYQALWNSENINEALHMIIRQYRIPLRICFFIDALDEHRGDHRRLLDTIQTLAQDRAGSAQIKLCLASRPEPIFRATLSRYPGFAIQQHTRPDIKIYVHGRIESSLAAYAGSFSRSELGVLTDEITNKASGVFLWVRLVVEELIEGIIDGSNIVQLRQILAQIPEELQDLYRRVLQARKNQYAYESYVMFQIVMHAYEPLSLRHLIAATDVILFGRWKRQWEEDSPDSMRRRLDSRCGGLLELLDASPDGDNEKVQLIHQTFKEFMKIPANAVSMFRYPAGNPQENGSLYMLRFCIHLLMQKSAGEPGDFRGLMSHLFTYAASSSPTASAEVSSLLHTMLQKTSIRAVKLPQAPISPHPDVRNKFEVLEINCDVLALWETGYLWAVGAFPHAHERPLMLDKWDFRKLPKVEHRDYDLLLLAASSGCLKYTAKQVADGISVELPQWQTLLRAILQGVVALNLRGVYYESRFLLDLLEDVVAKVVAKGPETLFQENVLCLMRPYENGTIPVSEGILECLVWLLDHGATMPSYYSEKWRRNCYRIWEVLERYSRVHPDQPWNPFHRIPMKAGSPNSGEYAGTGEENEDTTMANGLSYLWHWSTTGESPKSSKEVEKSEDECEEGGPHSTSESSTASEKADEDADGDGRDDGLPSEESEQDVEEESNEESDSDSEENKYYNSCNDESSEQHAPCRSVRRYIAHGSWYPSDGLWLLPPSTSR